MPKPFKKQVVKEYTAVPTSAMYKDGDMDIIDCPFCGRALSVGQHATTADGLPHAICGIGCDHAGEIIVVVD